MTMTNLLLPRDFVFGTDYPQLSRRLRLGVVGGGRIARMQSMAARMTDYWEIVAGVLSSDASQRQSRAQHWRIDPDRSYDSFTRMAKAEVARDDGVDAVMITTPNHLHAEACQAFLDVGISVLCDKPMTNTMAEAEVLARCVDQADAVFGVSYVMSCFPMIRQARDLVTRGEIGRVNQIHVEFLQDWMTPPDIANADHVRWRLDPAKSGATSCTGDIGTHAAHLGAFVSGCELTDLRADMHVCGSPKPLEDTVFMTTRFNRSIPGTLIASRMAPGNRGGLRVRIFGSEGGVEWNMERCEQLVFCRYGEPDRMITRGHGHGVSPMVERMLHCARGFGEGIVEAWANLYTELAIAVAAHQDSVDIPPEWLLLPPVEDGLRGVRFIESAVQSHSAGGVWCECLWPQSG